MSNEYYREIEALFPDAVLIGDAVSEKYAVDWSAENAYQPTMVVRPKRVEDISSLLAYCNTNDLPVVTQGGLTGLAGGATPQQGEVVLSLERLSGITEIDSQSMTLTALAGTPLEQLQQAAEDAGFYLPLDLGARGSCTIGGNVSTNAGGNQVLYYGMTRALVLGLTAIKADGTVIRSMNKMLKNNAGYDLKQLFIGSEGTLGIVTEVVLRLYPKTLSKKSALCAFDNFNDVVGFLQTMQRRLSRVTAFELMWSNYVEKVFSINPNCSNPFTQKYPLYVLIEAEGSDIEYDGQRFDKVLADYLEQGNMLDAVVAQSNTDAEKFWHIRDGVSSILSAIKYRANFDIGVPVSVMDEFVKRVERALEKSITDLQLCTFGHMADGNLHLLAWTDSGSDDHKEAVVQSIYQQVYEIVGEMNGTVTAEHGIGAMKRKYLKLCRSEEEIALMRTLKQAMDPKGILNPNRVL
ncbi:FAD-binding oxidoreductase [Pseudomonadales bacterium]|nr:FAD-binding oxidoreductase [Pseudomonadales bacterium]